MKKSAKLLCGAILISALLFLVSCGGTRVVFDIGDATLVSGELKQTYKDGVTIVPPEITKEGYALVGWDGNYENPTEATTVTFLSFAASHATATATAITSSTPKATRYHLQVCRTPMTSSMLMPTILSPLLRRIRRQRRTAVPMGSVRAIPADIGIVPPLGPVQQNHGIDAGQTHRSVM